MSTKSISCVFAYRQGQQSLYGHLMLCLLRPKLFFLGLSQRADIIYRRAHWRETDTKKKTRVNAQTDLGLRHLFRTDHLIIRNPADSLNEILFEAADFDGTVNCRTRMSSTELFSEILVAGVSSSNAPDSFGRVFEAVATSSRLLITE